MTDPSPPKRSLRPRKEGQSFLQMLAIPGLDDEDEEMGDISDDEEAIRIRKKLPVLEDANSDSEYDPVEATVARKDDAAAGGETDDASGTDVQEVSNDDEDGADSLMDGSIIDTSTRLSASKKSRNAPRPGLVRTRPSASASNTVLKEAVASFNFKQKRPGNRNSAPNPLVSLTRSRPKPLFIHPGPSCRLEEQPSPFATAKFVPTTRPSGVIENRLGRAWGNAVFPGPVWQMLEDIGWYKEINRSDSGERTRKVVHEEISIQLVSYEILSQEAASVYLPSDLATNEDGSWKPPPPVNCLFGPYGEQTQENVEPFRSIKLSKYFPECPSRVLNSGGPVWGLDWCPASDEMLDARNFVQYLAVSTFPTCSYAPVISSKLARPAPACLQIWSLGPGLIPAPSKALFPQKRWKGKGKQEDIRSLDAADAELRCEMILCIESGPALDLKWCPLPSHDPVGTKQVTRKLGVLAGVFGDGSISVFAIPDPLPLRDKQQRTAGDDPVYVSLKEPIVRIELDDTTCTCMDWANSQIIAVGCSNGNIAVFDISNALRNAAPELTALLPVAYIAIAQVAIRSVVWVRVPPPSEDDESEPDLDGDPFVVASTSYDGSMYVTDVRDPYGHSIFRARDVPYNVAAGPYSGGVLASEHDNSIKIFSLMPDMYGRGHTTTEANGPIWDIATSDYHPYIATASSDGTCCTSNLMKPSRRGGVVPMFIHKVYQMDYNRLTKQYRMLQNFIPQEINDGKVRARQTAEAKKQAKLDAQKPYSALSPDAQREARRQRSGGEGAWPTEVGVHRVVWNNGNGYGSAGMLASGMSCGFVRIDFLEGRFYDGNKFPYVSIDQLRGEGEANVKLEDADDE